MSAKLLKTMLALIPLSVSLTLSAQVADPLYPQQWHLKNKGQTAFSSSGGVKGVDLNVQKPHRKGVRGQKIQVTVIDTGVQIDHVDLANNVVSGSKNLLDNSNYPTDENGHGTSVAGIIAAEGYNNEGVRGIAPSAGINGFNFLSEQSLSSWLVSHGLSEGTKGTHVFNQSYGGGDIFPRAYDPEQDIELGITEDTMMHVSKNNANGRGAAFIKSAGNGFNFFGFSSYFILPGNYFSAAEDGEIRNHGLPMENSNGEIGDANFWNTVVSAINANGVLSSYSSVGANVFMTAPGGEFGSNSPAMVTVDLMGCDAGFNKAEDLGQNGLHGGTDIDPNCNYNSVMNGTSSAAPSMSGSIAMVMSANKKLTARDAKHILAMTAKKVDKNNLGVMLPFTDINGNTEQFQAVDGWNVNAAGYPYHLFYGLGLPNVKKAVALAQKQGRKKYKKLPKLKVTPWDIENTHLAIPDASLVGATSIKNVRIKKNLTIEGVQIKLDLDHSRLSDLSIELISPSGTRSVLMTPRSGVFVGQSVVAEPIDGLRDQLLLSHHFYGEKANGNWRLRVIDVGGEGDGDWILYDRTNGTPSLIEPVNNANDGIITNWSIRFFGHKGK